MPHSTRKIRGARSADSLPATPDTYARSVSRELARRVTDARPPEGSAPSTFCRWLRRELPVDSRRSHPDQRRGSSLIRSSTSSRRAEIYQVRVWTPQPPFQDWRPPRHTRENQASPDRALAGHHWHGDLRSFGDCPRAEVPPTPEPACRFDQIILPDGSCASSLRESSRARVSLSDQLPALDEPARFLPPACRPRVSVL